MASGSGAGSGSGRGDDYSIPHQIDTEKLNAIVDPGAFIAMGVRGALAAKIGQLPKQVGRPGGPRRQLPLWNTLEGRQVYDTVKQSVIDHVAAVVQALFPVAGDSVAQEHTSLLVYALTAATHGAVTNTTASATLALLGSDPVASSLRLLNSPPGSGEQIIAEVRRINALPVHERNASALIVYAWETLRAIIATSDPSAGSLCGRGAAHIETVSDGCAGGRAAASLAVASVYDPALGPHAGALIHCQPLPALPPPALPFMSHFREMEMALLGDAAAERIHALLDLLAEDRGMVRHWTRVAHSRTLAFATTDLLHAAARNPVCDHGAAPHPVDTEGARSIDTWFDSRLSDTLAFVAERRYDSSLVKTVIATIRVAISTVEHQYLPLPPGSPAELSAALYRLAANDYLVTSGGVESMDPTVAYCAEATAAALQHPWVASGPWVGLVPGGVVCSVCTTDQ